MFRPEVRSLARDQPLAVHSEANRLDVVEETKRLCLRGQGSPTVALRVVAVHKQLFAVQDWRIQRIRVCAQCRGGRRVAARPTVCQGGERVFVEGDVLEQRHSSVSDVELCYVHNRSCVGR
jgi:hypothetical protein